MKALRCLFLLVVITGTMAGCDKNHEKRIEYQMADLNVCDYIAFQ